MKGESLTYNERSRLEVEIEEATLAFCRKEDIHELNFTVKVNKIGDCIGALIVE